MALMDGLSSRSRPEENKALVMITLCVSDFIGGIRRTFGRWRQCSSLDGVRLQAPVKHVVPQLHHAVLPPGYKTLHRRHQMSLNGETSPTSQFSFSLNTSDTVEVLFALEISTLLVQLLDEMTSPCPGSTWKTRDHHGP